jgi:hypothetical protein
VFIATLALMSAVCAVPSIASAQPEDSERSLAVPQLLDGHGWMTFRDVTPARGLAPEQVTTMLVHLPPRLGKESGTSRGIDESHGVVRTAPEILGEVDAIAWRGADLWCLFGEEYRSGRGVIRNVGSMQVVRTSFGAYAYEPGRFELTAPLWGAVDVIAFELSLGGPVALLRQRDELPPASIDSPVRVGHPGELSLRMLIGESWREWALPADIQTALASETLSPENVRARFGLVQMRSGFGLWSIDHTSGHVTLLEADTRFTNRTFGPPAPVQWTTQRLPLHVAGVAGQEASTVDLARVLVVRGAAAAEDTIVGVENTDGGVRLWSLRESGPTLLVGFDDLPEVVRIFPMHASGVPGAAGGMVGLSWGLPQALATRQSARSREKQTVTGEALMMREVSVRTGRVLYDGPARNSGLISTVELRILAALLIGVMASVILYVVRADSTGIGVLPKDVELADPVRRAFGAFIDYIIGAIVAAMLLGLPAFSLIRPSQLLEQESFTGLVLALVLAAVHSIIGEWWAGRSIGKVLMGIRTVRLRKSADAEAPGVLELIGFRAAFVRNLVKWGMPLLGVFMFIDSSRRHPGDVLGRTLVVQSVDEDPPEAA